jgi:O-antigen ligase
MDSQEESAQTRIQSWAEGWNMLKSSPVMGVGFGRFEDYNYHAAHNSLVQTFAELGLPGAFCFVGMFYWYFRGLRTKAGVRAPAEAGKWNSALISSGIGVLTCSWFLSRQYIVVLYILLALGASAAAFQDETAETPRMAMRWQDMGNISALTIIGIVLIYVSIRTLAVWNIG